MADETKQIYDSREWHTGDVITADALNKIENEMEYVSAEVTNAVTGTINDQKLNDTIARKLDSIVKYFPEEPTKENLKNVRMYVQPAEDNGEITVPTIDDYQTFKTNFVQPYTNKAYAVGDYVEYGDVIYKVLSAITKNGNLTDDEAWAALTAQTPSPVTSIDVMHELNNLINVYTSDNQVTPERNKIWIKQQGESVEVPTYEEFSDLKSTSENLYLKFNVDIQKTATYKYELNLKVGDKYKITSACSSLVSIWSMDVSQQTVEEFSGVNTGKTVEITATKNAVYLGFYSSGRGVLTVENISLIVPKLESQVTSMPNKAPLYGGHNRINPNTMITGIIDATGNITIAGDWVHTDFIEVTPGETLYVNKSSQANYCTYDENKCVVAHTGNFSGTYTVPQNVRFIKATMELNFIGVSAYISNVNYYTPYQTVQTALDSVRTVNEYGGLEKILASDRLAPYIGKEISISNTISLTQYGDRYKTISNTVFRLDADMFTWSANYWPLPRFVNCVFISGVNHNIVVPEKYITHALFINCVFQNTSLTTGANYVQSAHFIGCRFFGTADIIGTKNCSDIVFDNCQGETDFKGAIIRADSSSVTNERTIDRLTLSKCVFEGNDSSVLIEMSRSGVITIDECYFEELPYGVLNATGTSDNNPTLLLNVRDTKFYNCGSTSIMSIDSSYSDKNNVYALFNACEFGTSSSMSLLDNQNIAHYLVQNCISSNVTT